MVTFLLFRAPSGDRQDGTNQGLDVARSSVDGLRSTLRREMGNFSGFLRTVRDWPF